MPWRRRAAAGVAVALMLAAGPAAALPACRGYTVDAASPVPWPDAERVVAARVAPHTVVVRTGPGSTMSAAAGMEVAAAGQPVCLISVPGTYHTRLRLDAPGLAIERVGVGVCSAGSGMCEWVEIPAPPARAAVGK